jgi:uncharacterized protein (DUF2141 family)
MPRVILTVAILIGPTLAAAAELQVEIVGTESGTGTINVGLFSRPEEFPKTPIVGQRLPAEAGKVVAIFRDLAPGPYAVSAFLDQNANNILDRNLLGVPTERYGFSRDAMGRMGPPAFDDAKIMLGPEGQTITITLR